MLDIKSISKTFNPGTINAKTAISGLSLHLEKGDFVTIIGSNGAGKSTLFNAVAGAFYVDDGEILLDNVNVRYKKYKTAIENFISYRQIQDLLDNNEELVIAVSGQNENGCERIVQSLSDCTQRKGIYCHSISADIVSSAHDNGLSCGRYEAYLNAKEYYPELTAQEALNMTMKELHELCGTENSHKGNHHRGGHNNK